MTNIVGAARILVADDDPAVLQTITWILKEHGYDVFPYGPLVQMAYIVAPAATPAPIRERLIEIFD